MTDIEQLVKHLAVVEARIALHRLRFATDWTTQEQLDEKVDRTFAAAVAKVRAEAFETAKDIYRGVHSGGCRRPGIGDECECFLCQIDDVAYPELPQPREVK